MKKLLNLASIILLAVLSAVNYIIFIFPNKFAPAGLDGICTMIQDVFSINMGYLSLIANLPLLVFAYIYLNRKFSVNTTIYIIAFSLSTILLKNSPLSLYGYHTESGSSIILAPIAAGTIRGLLYSLTLKLNCCSGGMDIVAAIIMKKKPHLKLMSIIFAINMCIAVSSCFVYGMKLDPVICSIIYSFITSSTGKHLQELKNETVKFEIITSDSDNLYSRISKELHLPATVMEAHGAYSGENKKLLLCVSDKETAPKIEIILKSFPDSVVFKSTIDTSQITDYSKSGL